MTVSKDNKTTKHLDVVFGGFSDKGVKAENQDAFIAHQPPTSVREIKGSVVCIADGVSCSDNAKQASQTSVTTFINDYFSTPDAWSVKEAVAKVLSSLNSWLFYHGQQASYRQNGLVTTFSGLVFKSNTANIFHIGDSRVYLFRKGKLRLLSKDHCHFQNDNKSFLTRALGMDSHLEVDFLQQSLKVDDIFLLTTDGVHEHVSEQQLVAFLQPLLDEVDGNSADSEQQIKQRLESIAAAVAQLALRQGSQDNLSCMLAKINQLPNHDINEVSRQLTAQTIPPALTSGMKIDNFVVDKVLHTGARSHVYVVKDQTTAEKYVLKAPSQNFAEDLNYLEGFIREQWVGSRINSKGVMKVYGKNEFSENSPFLYHVCEYVEGQTLRQWMYDNPQPSLTQVRNITAEIISALRVFQRQSMVHRDLKPENIMVLDSGKIKLIDFGTVQVSGLAEIRSALDEDTPVGAVGYIAPEYLLGSKGSHASDLFSLGVIVYEMLTGEMPFKAPLVQHQKVNSTEHWHYRSATRVRNDLPIWLDLALKKATAPNLNSRYQAFSEFLLDISTPNQNMVNKIEAAPLLERNPVAFWKMLAGVLALVVVLQFYIMMT